MTNNRVSLLVMVINLFLLTTYFSSCNTTRDRSQRRLDVKTPSTNIQDRSVEQKNIAKEVAKDVPEVEGDMDSIVDLADMNIEDAQTIKGKQVKIDKLEGDLASEIKAHAKTTKELKEKKTNIVMKILYAFFALGIILMSVAPVLFFWGKVEIKRCIILFASGAFLSGLSLVIIVYFCEILWTIIILGLITIGIGIWQLIEYMNERRSAIKHKQISEELIDTWEDDRADVKGSHSLELKQLVVNRKFENERGSKS